MEQLHDVTRTVSNDGMATVKRLLPQWQLARYVALLLGLAKDSKSGILEVNRIAYSMARSYNPTTLCAPYVVDGIVTSLLIAMAEGFPF